MRTGFGMIAALILAAAFVSGCGQAPTQVEKAKGGKGSAAAEKEAGSPDTAGWWCKEHGVPEEICALCSSKLAGDFKKKGDWCKEHDRPESQCFKCHPNLEAKFAAQYEAKYGQKPPKPTE